MLNVKRLSYWLFILILSLFFAFLGFWWAPLVALLLVVVLLVGASGIVSILKTMPRGKMLGIFVLSIVVGIFAALSFDIEWWVMSGLLFLVGLGVLCNEKAKELHSYANPGEKILEAMVPQNDPETLPEDE